MPVAETVTPFPEQSNFQRSTFICLNVEVLCVKCFNGYLPAGVGGYTNLLRAAHQEVCCYYISPLKTDHILKDCIINRVRKRQRPGTRFWLVAA